MRMIRSLVRLAYPYGSIRTAFGGCMRGLKFVVQPSMGFSYASGSKTFRLAFFNDKVFPGMTVYDIGANRGVVTLYFCRRVGKAGKVYAFEPVPEFQKILETNIALNQFSQAEVVPVAISNSSGETSFCFSNDFSNQGKLASVEPSYELEGAHTVRVRTLKLDSFLSEGARPPDIIKLDVEGAGAAVLEGATKLLDNHRPSIYIELHGDEERKGVQDYLLNRGYMAESPQGERIADATKHHYSELWCYPFP